MKRVRYRIYQISRHPGKNGLPYIGVTQDVARRAREHRVPITALEVLYTTARVKKASAMEQHFQRKLLGKADGRLYCKGKQATKREKSPAAIRVLLALAFLVIVSLIAGIVIHAVTH